MLYGAASVEAKSLTIGSVLEERYPFAVPRYQRAYAWDDEAVGYFARDIEEMLSKPTGKTSHFFGGVVCIELTDNQRVRPLSYEVVDGQQRLATFMLALSCVVEVARDLEQQCGATDQSIVNRAATLRTDTAETYMTWKEADITAGVTNTKPRLTLSLADDPVFQALTYPTTNIVNSTRESHTLLLNARKTLLDMTRKFVGTNGTLGERVDRLLRLRQALVQDSYLIHIVSRERSQAYRLFSVLNHRGESLSDADLLRSRSLELLKTLPTEHENVAKIWDEMLGAPAKDVESFFRALYPSWTGDRAKGDLFEATDECFFPKLAPATTLEARDLVGTIESFRDELSVFLRLIKGVWPYERPAGVPSQVRAWQVDRLRRLVVTLRHELALPVLLAGARTLSESDFAGLVYMLEIFAFRYKIICNGHATRAGTLYYQESKKMRDTTKTNPYSMNGFRAQLRSLINTHAANGLFRQMLLENLRYNNSSQRANIREFLTTIEDHRQWWLKTGSTNKNAQPKPTMSKVIDIDDATLEHIYPQNADSQDRDPMLEPHKHSIGNLTFFSASDNVAAANKSFVAKTTSDYANSNIGMTSELARNKTWTVTELKDREAGLLKQALRIFVV